MLVLGIDPVDDVLDVPGLAAQRELIRYPDVVLWDELSRAEYGPIAEYLRAGREVVTEVSRRQITVKGLVRLGVMLS